MREEKERKEIRKEKKTNGREESVRGKEETCKSETGSKSENETKAARKIMHEEGRARATQREKSQSHTGVPEQEAPGEAMICIPVAASAPTTTAPHTLQEPRHLIREVCNADAQYLRANVVALLYLRQCRGSPHGQRQYHKSVPNKTRASAMSIGRWEGGRTARYQQLGNLTRQKLLFLSIHKFLIIANNHKQHHYSYICYTSYTTFDTEIINIHTHIHLSS